MNKNFDEQNEEDQHHYLSGNNPRVIEIPVQHYTASTHPSNYESGVNSNSLPKVSDLRGGPPHHQKPDSKFKNQDFFNRNSQGIFEDFPSHFDLIDSPISRNRSLFNREQPFGSRFDEFFRPNLSPSPSPHHHSSAEHYLNRAGKSPQRDILTQTSPPPSTYIDQTDRQSNPNRQSPTVGRTESPKLRTESPRLISGIQIPIQHVPIGSDFHNRRTESPNRQSSTPPTHTNQHQQAPIITKAPINKLPEPPQKIAKQHVVPDQSKSPSDFIKNSPQQQQQSRFEQSPKSSPEPVNQSAPAPTPAQLKQQQHKPKPQPVINLPKVIPLPDPHPPQPSDNQQKPTDTSNMGNTFQGQHSSTNTANKRHAGGPSDFTHPHQASPQPESQTKHCPPQAAPQKTQIEKLNEIAAELEQYEEELTTMKPGCGKKDKLYLRLDEFITRCLLKLDEILKTDDIIHQRKQLIVASNRLLDQLEQIATEEKSEDANLSETEPPSSKRPKSPKCEPSKEEEEKCDSNENAEQQ